MGLLGRLYFKEKWHTVAEDGTGYRIQNVKEILTDDQLLWLMDRYPWEDAPPESPSESDLLDRSEPALSDAASGTPGQGVLDAWALSGVPASNGVIRRALRAMVESGKESMPLSEMLATMRSYGHKRPRDVGHLRRHLVGYINLGRRDYNKPPLLSLDSHRVRNTVSWSPDGDAYYRRRGRDIARHENGELIARTDGEEILYPVMRQYAATGMGLGMGSISARIIHQGKESPGIGKGDREWLHADLWGYALQAVPSTDERPEVTRLREAMGEAPAEAWLHAFEVKCELTLGDLNYAYFQTLSDAGMAHYSWLAAAEIAESCLPKLRTLCRRFGVGAILLDPAAPESSRILHMAVLRERPDWETIASVAENSDFREFLTEVAEALEREKGLLSHLGSDAAAVDSLRHEEERLTELAGELDEMVGTLRLSADAEEGRLREARRGLAEIEEQVETVTRKLANTEEKVSRLKEDARVAEDEVTRASREAEDARGSLDGIRDELDTARACLKDARRGKEREVRDAEAAQAAAENAHLTLARSKEDTEEARHEKARLDAEAEQVRQGLDILRKQVGTLESKADVLRAELSRDGLKEVARLESWVSLALINGAMDDLMGGAPELTLVETECCRHAASDVRPLQLWSVEGHPFAHVITLATVEGAVLLVAVYAADPEDRDSIPLEDCGLGDSVFAVFGDMYRVEASRLAGGGRLVCGLSVRDAADAALGFLYIWAPEETKSIEVRCVAAPRPVGRPTPESTGAGPGTPDRTDTPPVFPVGPPAEVPAHGDAADAGPAITGAATEEGGPKASRGDGTRVAPPPVGAAPYPEPEGPEGYVPPMYYGEYEVQRPARPVPEPARRSGELVTEPPPDRPFAGRNDYLYDAGPG